MRLAVVTNYYPDRRPLSEYGPYLVRGLRESRPAHEVLALAGSPGPAGVWRPWSYGGRLLFKQIVTAVSAVNPDAVLVNATFTSWGDDHLSNLLGFFAISRLARLVPTVALVHYLPQTLNPSQAGIRIGPLARCGVDLACRFAARADVVAFPLERDRLYFASHFPCRRVIGVEHGVFERPQWIGWGSEYPTLLTLGVWGLHKRPEALLQAVERHPQLRLIVGGFSHRRAPSFVENLRLRYESERVRFVGYIPEDAMAHHFQQSHLVVLPYSENTGSSSVLRLACQYGRAVLASDLPVFRHEAQRLGIAVHFYTDAADLESKLLELTDEPARLEHEGRHNALAVSGLDMAAVGETFWGLLEGEDEGEARGRWAMGDPRACGPARDWGVAARGGY